jgi:lipoprotein NlpD
MPRLPVIALGLILPVLAACAGPGGIDFDFRGGGVGTAAQSAATASRPEPDAFGLITYPTYQVVVAQRGDSVTDVANRIGMDPDELARFNGRNLGDPLRQDEVLALPRRVTPAGSTTGANDITSIASAAIDRADAATPATPNTATVSVQGGSEPVRHRVARGETAYSISRLYGVSVRSLADWNGLGPDLTVREGQFLIIPLILESADAGVDGRAPGASVTPVPPSAADPLPEAIETAELPDAPDLTAPTPDLVEEPVQPAATTAVMQRPVQGEIIREFSGSSEGIDIAASAGTSVGAAADGEVAAITRDTDQVPILVLRHPGNLLTVYANIDNIRVERGDRVSRGQTIADVGAGDPAFLHFEVRQGFDSVDPMRYLR